MTIPSIKMTETSATDGPSTSAGGAGEDVASFASFLGDEADGASTGKAPFPRAEVLQGVRVSVSGKPTETTKGEVETPVLSSANTESFATVATLRGHDAGDRRAQDETPGNGVIVGMKSGGGVKGKTNALDAKAGEKRPAGDASAGVGVRVDPLPVPVEAPVSDVGAAAPMVRTVRSLDEPRSLSIEDRSFECQPVGQDAALDSDGELPTGGVGADVRQQGEIASSDVASVQERPEEAVMQTEQRPVDLSSMTNLLQAAQQEAAGGDAMRPVESTGDAGIFLQKRPHALAAPADKSPIPATPTAVTIGSPLVADPTAATANQQPFYVARGIIGSFDSGENDRGTEAVTPETGGASPGAERGTGRPEPGFSRTAATSSLGVRLDQGGVFGTGAFGLNVSKELDDSTAGNSAAKDVVRSSTASTFEQFAMERMQTAGATRALGDALQSTMGLGVQTESFGRVTIHTATEGNHLLAQVTLEDGRQSATLVSHVPGVEQKLTQQFGMEAAVRVSTESQSSMGGGTYGDSGREARQQRDDVGDTNAAKAGQRMVAEVQPGEVRVPSSWSQGSTPGRLDVTV